MITSSGPLCDVCGEYILLELHLNWFSVPGIKTKMCCHQKCLPVLKAAIFREDWKMLPKGPLRKVFEEQEENKKIYGEVSNEE